MLNERRPINAEIRQAVYDKYNGRCTYCGRQITWSEFTIDHIVPLANGGTNEIDNLTCSCEHCNYLKGTKNTREFKIFVYTIIANALRFINNGLYDFDTGKFEFYSEKKSYNDFSLDEKKKFNNMLAPQMERFRKYINNPKINDKANMDTLADSIQNSFNNENKPPIKKSYTITEDELNELDKQKEEELQSEVSKVFESADDTIEEPEPSPMIPEEKEEDDSKEENVQQLSNPLPKGVFVQAEFKSLPKTLSPNARHFLGRVGQLFSTNPNLPLNETIAYYAALLEGQMDEKDYSKVVKELVSRGVLTGHKKFRKGKLVLVEHYV